MAGIDVGSEKVGSGRGNIYLSDPAKGLQLLMDLVSAPSIKSGNYAILDEIEDCLKTRFLEICAQGETPDEVRLYARLLSWFENLVDVESFPALHNKNIVAVGGAFSAGKSRFLNSLFGKQNMLPTSLNPTTAIPTFIHQGQEDSIFLRNCWNNRCVVDPQAVQALSHDFSKAYNAQFLNLIRQLVIEYADFPFSNVTVLDTPGYSNPEASEFSKQNDYEKAKTQILNADHLIWVVDSEKGTLPEDDIGFLYDLNFTGSIYVVFNKADKSLHSIETILETAREALEYNEIKIEGICAYSSVKPGMNGKSTPVYTWLESINTRVKYASILNSLSRYLEPFSLHHASRKGVLKKTLQFANMMKLKGVALQEDVDTYSLDEWLKDTKRKIAGADALTANFESFRADLTERVKKLLTSIAVNEGETRKNRVPFSAVIPEQALADYIKTGMELEFTISTSNIIGIYLVHLMPDGQRIEGCIPHKKIKQYLTVGRDALFDPETKLTAEVTSISLASREAIFSVELILGGQHE